MIAPHRFFTRSMLSVLILGLFSLGLGGFWYFRSQKENVIKTAERHLRAVSRYKAEEIALWRQERLADATVLGQDPFFVQRFKTWMTGSDPAFERDFRVRCQGIVRHYRYRNVIVFAPGGAILWSLNEEPLPMPEYTNLLTRVVEKGEPMLGEIMLDASRARLSICAMAPILDPGSGRFLGAIALTSDPNTFLYPLIHSWPGASRTSETTLFLRKGEEVHFLHKVRHQGDRLEFLRIPMTRKDMPTVRAALGHVGQHEGPDYREEPVLAAITPIRDSSWLMAAKQDRKEVFADWHVRARWILLILTMLALGIVALVLEAWQRQRKDYYRQLYNTERDYRLLFTRMSEGFVLHKVVLNELGEAVDLRFLDANPAFERMTGLSRQTIVGRTAREILPNFEKQWHRQYQSVARTGHPSHFVSYSKRLDKHLEISTFDAGQGRLASILRDITERVVAARHLQASEKKFRELFDNHSAVKLIIDPTDGRIVDANQAAAAFYGWSIKQLRHMRITEINTLPPEKVQKEMKPALNNDKVHFEFQHRKADGSVADVEVFSSPVILGNRRYLHSIVHDISEKRVLEKELLRAQKTEAVARLAGGVAHDLNNMLGTIIGNAELILDFEAMPPQIQAEVNAIILAAKRSAEVTHQLLAFAGRQVVMPRIMRLDQGIKAQLDTMQRILGPHVELVWQPGRTSGLVKIDPAQLRQILTNLCENAREAIDSHGTVTIATGHVLGSPDGAPSQPDAHQDYAWFSISDNGCGMPRETLDKIFEPFFTTKGVSAGEGLGLATIDGIVKQNHGFIEVVSHPGQGSTFTIHLPCIEREHEAAQ